MKTMCFLMIAVVAVLGAKDYTPATTEEMQQYVVQINKALSDHQGKIDALLLEIGSGDKVITANDRGALERLKTDLEAKTIMSSNLQGTEVLERSPKVRQKLLEVLNDESLTPEDILALQQVINEEKAAIQKVPVEAAPTEQE